MANTSTLYARAGLASFWMVLIDTADSTIAIDTETTAGDPYGGPAFLTYALSYNNLAHNLTFESYNPVTAAVTTLPPLEFDGSIGMLEPFGRVLALSKPKEILRVKSSAQPVQYFFGISYDQECLRK